MRVKSNAQEFTVKLNEKLKNFRGGLEEGVKDVVLEVFSSVVMATPVLTGRARANWFPSVGTPSSQKDDSAEDKNGSKALQKINDFRTSHTLSGNVVWLTNNLPYIEMLEYGGYPSPVKRGTWMGAGKGYEIRSSGGFSRQAPEGMVRLTLQRFKDKGIITRIIMKKVNDGK